MLIRVVCDNCIPVAALYILDQRLLHAVVISIIFSFIIFDHKENNLKPELQQNTAAILSSFDGFFPKRRGTVSLALLAALTSDVVF